MPLRDYNALVDEMNRDARRQDSASRRTSAPTTSRRPRLS